MNYKLLQVGDETTDGDEVWSPDAPKWRKAWPGDKVAAVDINYGRFYRRSSRRDMVEVMAEDEDCYGLFVMTVDLGDDPHLYMENDHTYVSCPITYAQKLVDAIKEVAGL